jgi:hypothetical protein
MIEIRGTMRGGAVDVGCWLLVLGMHGNGCLAVPQQQQANVAGKSRASGTSDPQIGTGLAR